MNIISVSIGERAEEQLVRYRRDEDRVPRPAADSVELGMFFSQSPLVPN